MSNYLAPAYQRGVHEQLAALADMRLSPDERTIYSIAREWDPQNPHHDLTPQIFPPNPDFTPQGLRFMAEMVLCRFDAADFPSDGTTPIHDRVVTELRDTLSDLDDRQRAGERTMILTGHQTRIEPAVAAYFTHAALADGDDGRHVALRDMSTVFVSRYLSTWQLDASKFTGSERNNMMDLLTMARGLGAITLTFPNSENMRKHSGVDAELQRWYNAEMRKKVDALSPGSLGFMVASGTKVAADNGVYSVPAVKPGTIKLLRSGWNILPIASALEGSDAFAVAGALVEAKQVTDTTIHDAEAWIADTCTLRQNEQGIVTRYQHPSAP